MTWRGATSSPGEKQTPAHMWRRIGHVMGVPDDLQSHSYERAVQLRDIQEAFDQRTDTDSAKTLTQGRDLPMNNLTHGIRGTRSGSLPRRGGIVTGAGVRLLPVLAASAALLSALPCTAHAGDIKFAVARDYPASTGTYTGSAGPGAVAHFYRDGHADENVDMVIANSGGGPVVLYGLGGGRFSTQRNIISIPDADASVVEVGDFNADGIPDIVSGSSDSTARMTVLLGRPDGRFAVGGQYQLHGSPTRLEPADFNRDGHLDIAASAYAAATLTILLGNGDGSFREVAPGPEAIMSLIVKAADFDGDGIPDLAVGETVPRNAPGSNLLRGELHILLGNGDGTFRPLASYPVGDAPEQIEYADINEDGKKDLVTTTVFITNDISILYGLGGGRFAPEERMRIGGPGSSDIFDVHAAESVEGVQLADFNGDGHLDMAVTQIVSSKAVLFEGNGRGDFTPAGSYDVAGFPEGFIAPADLNDDGCPDLVVPGNLPPVGPSDVGVARVSVLLNLSEGCRTRPAAAANAAPALQCTTRRLVLEDVRIRGRRVKLVGVANPRFAGRTVSFRFRGTGRIVARTKARSDGTFSATAPLPAKKLRDTARYQANIGNERSNALKLTRRITVRPLTLTDGKVTITGRVSPPLANPKALITLTRRVSCRYQVVRRFRPRADGTFVVTVAAPKGGAAAVYRLGTRVRRFAHGRRTFPTFSLPLYYRGT